MSSHSAERNEDGRVPIVVHRGRNRAERRAIARKGQVKPPPAINKPYVKKED